MKQRRALKPCAFWLVGCALLLAGTSVSADKFELEVVSRCVACHGADGIGKANEYPDLQGKPEEYLVAQLNFFKAGIRKSSSMNLIAEPLSDSDIEMLARYFSQVK